MENEIGGGPSAVDDLLSSPPSSLSDMSPANNHQSSRDTSTFGVSAPQPQLSSSKNSPHPSLATTSNPAATGDVKPRIKKSREPVVLPDGSIRERKKPGPKPKPKDPNAPVQPRRKKQKLSEAPTSVPPPSLNTMQQPPPQASSRQPKITEMVGSMQPNATARANSEVHIVAPLGTPTNNAPRPASSGQLFDPIRGDTVQAGHASRVSSPTAARVASVPVSPLPPTLLPPNVKSQNPFTAPPNSTLVARPGVLTTNTTQLPGPSTEQDLEKIRKMDSNSAGPSSNAPTLPSQKQQRAKEQPPPLPSGSGLLSGTPFGGLTSAPATNGTSGTNIWLTFPLKGQTNVTINFAREVERKYGFAALHPRLAARNERRKQLAAASNALEKSLGQGSNDDMSLDLSEPESNVEMGGIDDENSTGPTTDGRKKRKKKIEEYDRNDDFIDDTEKAWEENALMAKDGFFVYSGPLVTETDKPAVDRVDGITKRGRGRGRGGTTRGDTTGRGRGGGGRGSRGGATVRKPRVTKADRAMMEQEKLEREKMAATLAARPTQQPQPTAAVS
ncbi:histone promoter control 2 [Tothia fuscella]|uniref:Histone promoter control 2 n=1 Tax=Tothia fuscella TaxID=1048955 RepID=A0A9P4NWN0_9PEZI|nr:histone promoter control 2 [Tothia fuscella]